MGRVAKGWGFTCRRGVYGIRWRQEDPENPRPEVSLGTKDINEAKRLAPIVYAERVSGVDKNPENNCKADPAIKLKELIAKWIVAIKPELGVKTDETYIIYGNHWLKHLKFLADVRPAKVGDYQRARLNVVKAGTVRLELSAMRRFFKWLKEQEYIKTVPEFPELGRKVLGTNYAVPRRKTPVTVFSPEEMDKIIDGMDQWSKRKVHGKRFPVQSRFVVARETGLRPTTIDGLLGKDLIVSGLHIRKENDKNRWERVVPLTDRARKALESVLPEDPDAPIFGTHEWGKVFYPYVVKALGQSAADRMTPYDLKHGLVTELFDSGAPETGIQFLTGTKSAIRRYSHPTRSAAEAAIGGRAGDKAVGGQREQLKRSLSVVKADISYTKPKSKNTVISEVSERRKTRK
jgi:integrase